MVIGRAFKHLPQMRPTGYPKTCGVHRADVKLPHAVHNLGVHLLVIG